MNAASNTHVKEIAVVVGAGGAFGKAIVKRLLEASLTVIAVGRSRQTLDALVATYPGVRPCVADISSDDSIEAIRKMLDAPVRIVVHGPGVPVAGGVANAPTQALVDAVNIKAAGMLRLVRAVESRLVRGSRLVGIGGHYGQEPTEYAAAAGVANAALANLMRQLNWGYGKKGITAHLIAPGPADTERLHRVAADRAASRQVDVSTVLDEMLGESAIHAFITPEQVAWAVGLLLSPEADALAGSGLMLDAGRRRGLP